MDLHQLKAHFDRDGFVVVREFVNSAQLSELRDQLDRYIAEVLPTLPKTAAFYHDADRPETLKQMQHMGSDPFFDQYRRCENWLKVAEALNGEPSEGREPEWFNKPPGTDHVTPPHQDNYYFCLRPANVLTMWLALDPVSEANGCLRYVQGSHRKGIRPHNATSVLGFSQGITDYGPQDTALEVPIEMQPGDLAIHHGQTIHRADANSTSLQRRSFAIVVAGVRCELDETAYSRYVQSMEAQHDTFGIDTANTSQPE